MSTKAAAAFLTILLVGATPGYAEFVYVTESAGTNLYRLDLDSTDLTDLGETLAADPNGNAWDEEHCRLYYTDADNPGLLFVWDAESNRHEFLGNLEDFGGPTSAAVFCGTFWDGCFFFVENGTADLWKVCFVGESSQIDAITFVGDMSPDSVTWGFGDIVIDSNGVLYGLGIRTASPTAEFFRYELATRTFLSIVSGAIESFPAYQLGTDLSGQLLAISEVDGRLFELDSTDGEFTFLQDYSIGMSDFAQATESVCSCPADLDDSDDVGFSDLLILLAAWGPPCPGCPADLDGSGEVLFGDLLILLAAWGPC